MKQSETRELFETAYQSRGLASQRRYPNESFIAFLGTNYFSTPPEARGRMRFLELGCGSGANLWVVGREGFSAYGIDSSPTALELCGQVLSAWGVKADIRAADMTALPFGDGEFHLIYDVVSMQHLNWVNHLMVWREVFRCLEPDGQFYSYHLGENSLSMKCGACMVDHCTVSNIANGFPLANNGNVAFLSANEVRRALAEIGFAKVVIDKISRTYDDQRQHVEYLSIVGTK